MALSALTIDMRELWRRVRLNAIRSTVEDVIRQLEISHGSSQLEDRESALDSRRTEDPCQAALQACCDELRTGCGMEPLHVAPTQPPAALPDFDWDARHAAALERYRSQARVALREALGPSPDGAL